MTATLKRQAIQDGTSGVQKMNIVIIGTSSTQEYTGRAAAGGYRPLPRASWRRSRLNVVKRRPFEYAFLLDALKDEQAQGITIDSARCFFKSTRRGIF
jgi:bifunctional enzyme CysN/CysC